jgi:RNA-directed DNA polymerase
VLIKGDAQPYDATHDEYFAKRAAKTASISLLVPELKRTLAKKQNGICPVCKTALFSQSMQTTPTDEKVEIHHIKPVKDGGTNEFKNLVLLHRFCHAQITHGTDPKLNAAWKIDGLKAE